MLIQTYLFAFCPNYENITSFSLLYIILSYYDIVIPTEVNQQRPHFVTHVAILFFPLLKKLHLAELQTDLAQYNLAIEFMHFLEQVTG